jgi:hypothetical protein
MEAPPANACGRCSPSWVSWEPVLAGKRRCPPWCPPATRWQPSRPVTARQRSASWSQPGHLHAGRKTWRVGIRAASVLHLPRPQLGRKLNSWQRGISARGGGPWDEPERRAGTGGDQEAALEIPRRADVAVCRSRPRGDAMAANQRRGLPTIGARGFGYRACVSTMARRPMASIRVSFGLYTVCIKSSGRVECCC